MTNMEKTDLAVKYPDFAERLKTALSNRQMELKELAEQSGIAYEMIRRYTHGYAMPRAKGMGSIAKCLNTNAAWLQFGTGEVSNEESNLDDLGKFNLWSDDDPLSDEYVFIPLFKDVLLSAGNGAFEGLEFTTKKIPFSKYTLRKYNVAYEDAACAIVKGNSMEKTLPHGTVVGIDLSKKSIIDGKLYAIYHNGLQKVKRLYLNSSVSVRIHSDNEEEYDDETSDIDDIYIIGKVFTYQVMLD